MKTFDECMAWVKAVDKHISTAPEGVSVNAAGNAGIYWLRGVDRLAISRLHETFGGSLLGNLSGEWAQLDLHLTTINGEPIDPIKPPQGISFFKYVGMRRNRSYRFFWRRESGRERREAYEYAT